MCGVKVSSGPSSTRSRSISSAHASSTLPLEVQCIGVRLPTQLTVTIERVPEIWST